MDHLGPVKMEMSSGFEKSRKQKTKQKFWVSLSKGQLVRVFRVVRGSRQVVGASAIADRGFEISELGAVLLKIQPLKQFLNRDLVIRGDGL
jgi:hypothetical protein